MIDLGTKHAFVFGVFCDGEIVFIRNEINCTHQEASFLVCILNLAKDCLMKGHYFAYDFKTRR